MPEGDTLFRTATTLRKVLLNQTLLRFETDVEAVASMAARNPLEGRVVTAVEARGKHLLITFSPGEEASGTAVTEPSTRRHKGHEDTKEPGGSGGTKRGAKSDGYPWGSHPEAVAEGISDAEATQPPHDPITQRPGDPTTGLPNDPISHRPNRSITQPPDSPTTQPPNNPTTHRPTLPPRARSLVLHTHLRMTGSWHVYRHGEEWRKPARQARVVLHTRDFVVPCFSAPIVELLTEWQAGRHPDLVTMGPDAMREEFDPQAAQQRILRHSEVEIGVALLNQRLMAGVGNIYKSEVLFVRRVYPFLKVGELGEEVVRGLVEESHRLLRLNQNRGNRRTVFHLKESDRLWVYGRAGSPCRVCGEPIQVRRQGIDARATYYCPRCQAPPPAAPG